MKYIDRRNSNIHLAEEVDARGRDPWESTVTGTRCIYMWGAVAIRPRPPWAIYTTISFLFLCEQSLT